MTTHVPLSARGRSRRSLFRLSTALLGALVVVLVVMPLATLLFRVFAPAGVPTMEPIREAFSSTAVWSGTIYNTLVIVFAATTLAVVLATGFAWLNDRTDARLGFFADMLPLTPLIVPPIVGAIGWVFLLSPRAGLLNVIIRSVFGIESGEGPLNIFSFPGMIFLYTLVLTPYAYLPISAALSRLEVSLDEASLVSGGSLWRTVRRVTIPAIKPAIASAYLLGIVIGFATFSIPIIVGTGADIEVLSVRIYRLLTTTFPPRTGEAVALCLVMVAVVALAGYAQRRTSRAGRHATLSPRGSGSGRLRIGRLRGPARLLMVGFMVAASVLPLTALLYVSTKGFWSASLTFAGSSFDNYFKVMSGASTFEALRTSAMLGLIGAFVGMIVAALIADLVRSGVRGSGLVDAATKAPGALTNIVIAVAFLIVFTSPPFRLYGSLILLLGTYIVLYLPQSTLQAQASLSQIPNEMLEASFVAGSSPGRTFRRISAPLMLPGLAGGAAVLFVVMAGEVTASSLLASNRTPVIGFVIIDLWFRGTFPQIAALGVIMTAVSAVVVTAVMFFGKHRQAGVMQR